MGQSGIWNLITWLYISLFCEFIYRKVVKGIRNLKQEHSEDEGNASDNEGKNDEKISSDTATTKVKPPSRGKGKTAVKFNKEALNRDIGDKGIFFGDRTVLSDIHNAAEQSLADDNLKRVISYYDKSGKLLYQREREIPKTAPTDAIAPKFHIKPKVSIPNANNKPKTVIDDGRKEYATTKVSLDEEMDKAFSDIFASLPSV